MYTATVAIAVNQFVPMNGVIGQSPSIDATISPPRDTSPDAPTGVFSGDGETIVVSLPKGYEGSVQLTFQLPNPSYVLLGVAFFPTPTPKGMSVGQREFRTVVINRDPSGSQMTVTDSCLKALGGINFEYVILVQDVASGGVGLIDPDIENTYE